MNRAELGRKSLSEYCLSELSLNKNKNISFIRYVYVLFSLKDRKIYIGFAGDLKNRFEKHEYGEVKSTRNRRPLKLIYYEAYLREVGAKRREKYLKGGNGRGALKIQLKELLTELGYRYL